MKSFSTKTKRGIDRNKNLSPNSKPHKEDLQFNIVMSRVVWLSYYI